MTTDVHAHYFPRSYIGALEDMQSSGLENKDIAHTLEGGLRHLLAPKDLAARAQLNETAGIDRQILSFSSPEIRGLDESRRIRLVERFNDGCLDDTAPWAERFLVLASLPLPHVAAALSEIERMSHQERVVGFSIPTHPAGQPIDGPAWWPVFKALDRLSAVVMVHPDRFCAAGALDDFGMEWTIGAPFEDTIAVTRLVFGGVIERFPSIRWIVPHVGGVIAPLAARVDAVWAAYPPAREALTELPSGFLDRLWFDTVTPSVPLLRLVREVLGSQRLCFGTDYPYVDQTEPGVGIDRLVEAGFSAAEVEAITHSNAASLFDIESSEA